MKVRILRTALDDLAAGRQFYDRQQEGVGEYFFDSLFTEINSLVLYAGVHRVLDCRRDPKWIHRALNQKG